ncbi:MAG: nitrate reductase molybdenum cofactor assembly chaperone [Candidatus Hydrogenedentes bacterium]|nr:nitrate reductase molybdenum cofactor assembly chaperone [Candidatus Hydrogenedentota bacterium]
MHRLNEHADIFARFATLLSYPAPDLKDRASMLAALLKPIGPPAARALNAFVQILDAMPPTHMLEHYTRAFDLAPLAVPYLSVYLFGAENPQRGQFMAGFNAAYADAGHDCQGELPDHLAVVLAYAAVAPEESWDEVQRLCLPAPLKHMRRALEAAGNPYQHVVTSLEHFVKHVTAGELSHA